MVGTHLFWPVDSDLPDTPTSTNDGARTEQDGIGRGRGRQLQVMKTSFFKNNLMF